MSATFLLSLPMVSSSGGRCGEENEVRALGGGLVPAPCWIPLRVQTLGFRAQSVIESAQLSPVPRKLCPVSERPVHLRELVGNLTAAL